jgi:hypothetical protein
MIIKNKNTEVINPSREIRLPFALPIIEGKKMKKKCCKKYKKGKRCKRCPGGGCK